MPNAFIRNIVALILLTAPVTIWAADFQPALGLLRNCDFLNERYVQAYSKVADLKAPPTSWRPWQGSLKQDYDAYQSFIGRMKKAPGYMAIAAKYGPTDAERFLETCMKTRTSWQLLSERYPAIEGMQDIVDLNSKLGAAWSPSLKAEIDRRQNQAAKIAREAAIEASARDFLELSIRTRHYVTLAFRKHGHLDPIGNATVNRWKEREHEVPVSQSAYQALSFDQELSSNFDWGAFFGGDGSLQSYKVRVSGKRQANLYFLRTRGAPAVKTISEKEYSDIVAVIDRLRLPVATSSFAGQSQVLSLSEGETIVRTEPAKRYFATLEIKNETTGLSILKHLRNQWLSHEIEIELTESDFNSGTANFATGWRLSNFLLSGWLSEMTGRVIRQRVTVDPSYEKVTLSDGRFYFRSKR